MASVFVFTVVGSARTLAQSPAPGLTPLQALRRSDATPGSPSRATYRTLALLDSTPKVEGSYGRVVWRTSVWVNSGRPMTDLDGPVWQGRGLTAATTGGVVVESARWSVALRPVVFGTQNLAYTPSVSRQILGNDFRHPIWGSVIDEPYRFGSNSLGRIDPGESAIEVRPARWLSTGASTGSEWWGPAHLYPLTMGAESGGIPRLFTEARPRTRFGSATVRYQLGRAEASGFDGLKRGERSRLVPALVATVEPAFVPGMEIGGGRLFHVRWQRNAVNLQSMTLPFAGLLKRGNPTNEVYGADWNQVATVFFTIRPSHAGVEVYGEFYKEDHNVDLRDLALEPDHAAAYMLGLKRAWRKSETVRSVTFEVANARPSHLGQVRSESALHTHGPVGEGHTFRGQPLGSSVVLGGGGMAFAFESVDATTGWYAHTEIRRTYQLRETGAGVGGGVYSLTAGRLRVRARGISGISGSLSSAYGADKGLNFQLGASFTAQRL